MDINKDFLEGQMKYWADYAHFLVDNRARARKFTQYLIDNFEDCGNVKGTLVNLMGILEEAYNS